MKPTSPRLILVISYLTYLLFGAFTAAVGPVLGELAHNTASSLAAIGGVVTFLFLGAIVAQLLGGPIADRLGDKYVLAASLFILALGILAFTTVRSLPIMFVLVLFAGFGQGGVDMGANLVVADSASHSTTSALNLLHFFFGLGAFVGPALVGLSIALSGSGLPVHWITAALFLLLGIAVTALVPGGPRSADTGELPLVNAAASTGVYRSPLLWAMAILLLLYVGVEIALGSWITAYMGITTGLSAQFGAWVTSAYWAALAVGRLVAAAAVTNTSKLRALAFSLGASFIGGIILLVGRTALVPTVIALVWIAFAFATVYPTIIALAAATFPSARGRAISILAAMGSLGAALFPLLAGALLEARAGFAFPIFVSLGLASLLVMLYFIYVMIRRASAVGPGSQQVPSHG